MSIFYQNRSERLRFYTSHNISFAAHLHRQAELVVLLEGEVRICVDHTEYLLSEGSAAIIFQTSSTVWKPFPTAGFFYVFLMTTAATAISNIFKSAIP